MFSKGIHKQILHIHSMEYYLSIEKKVLIHTITWVNPKNVLSERSQTSKICIVLFHLCEIQEWIKTKLCWQKSESA